MTPSAKQLGSEPVVLMEDRPPVIQMEGVSKTYVMEAGEVRALRKMNVRIQENEYAAIMGPSGSGKTTILNILGCLDTPSTGRYLLDGMDVGTFSENDLAEIRNRKIGFIFQTFNLLPRATVLRNVELPMIYSGRRRRRQVARDMLKFVGLGHRLDHRPNQLSGGEQQRVAIARALVNEPRIILADEPTGAIDSLTGEKIMALLGRLHAQGNTIIVVTHDDHIARKTDRVIRIRDGTIVREDYMVHL